MRKRASLFRYIASLLLTAMLLCCMPAYAAEETEQYSDVEANAWYANSVYYARDNDLMNGTSTSTFSPNLVMTRGMITTVLYRMAGSPSLEEIGMEDPFTDVSSDAWYASGIYWARAEGIVSGYGNQLFGPDDPVTREQMVTILWRFADQPTAERENTFSDNSQISNWASDAVSWASTQGVVAGKPGNLFDPSGQATRAEAAVILSRYHQQIVEGAQEPEPEPDPQPEPEPPVGTLLPNSYDSTAFVIENDFLTYQGEAPSYVGIDVSSHQGLIDWDRVAADGVEFAMIRVGYRGYTVGSLNQDSYWEYNINGALNAGLDVGIYFYSQATSVEEAQEEALYTLERINGYSITYPVVFDWERVSGPESRTSTTPEEVITACAQAFCQVIGEAGYTAMLYGSPSKVGEDISLSLLSEYPFWLAHYTTGWRPTSFNYHFDMWQYTSSGHVDGIDGRVDLDICLRDW